MKLQSKINDGFTLIELVIVIIILGILAAIATPRFLSLHSSARTGVLQSMAAGMRSEASIVHSLAELKNKPLAGSDAPRAVKTRFGLVETYNHYPESKADSANNLDIFDLISFKESDDMHLYTEDGIWGGCNSRKVGYNENNCYVKYSEACNAGDPVKVEIVSTNC